MQHFKCFLINLDKNPERLDFMDKQLKCLNIDYIRFPAIDGRKYIFTKEEYDEEKAKKVNKNNYGLSPGERGCALSHKKIYEIIVNENIDYALILEDDVELPKNLKEIINKEIDKNKKRNSWEYLSFDYYAYGIDFITKLWLKTIFNNIKIKKNIFKKIFLIILYIIKFIPVFFVCIILEEIQKLLFKNTDLITFRPIYFAGCYLITKSGANKLLKLNTPIYLPADRLPNQARIRIKKEERLKFKIYTPLLVKQKIDIFKSNIG